MSVYDRATQTATRLDYDADGNGRIEARVYLVGGSGRRVEADGDGNGRIDRWEYYEPTGHLERIGLSAANDGREDTWVVTAGPDMRVEIATRRDGVVDRWEFHEAGALVRTEEDRDRDGRVDHWQRFENGRLRELLADVSGQGRPTQRIVYATDGSVERIEDDNHGDNEATRGEIR